MITLTSGYLLIAIAVVVGSIAGFAVSFYIHKKKKNVLIEHAHKAARLRKTSAKARIMTHLKERGEIRNDDVEQIAGVSDATAERYLHELSEEDKIVRHGVEGRGVYYSLKKPQ